MLLKYWSVHTMFFFLIPLFCFSWKIVPSIQRKLSRAMIAKDKIQLPLPKIVRPSQRLGKGWGRSGSNKYGGNLSIKHLWVVKAPKSFKTRTNSFHKMCPFVLILAKYNRNGILRKDLGRQAFPLYQTMYSYLFNILLYAIKLPCTYTHM